MIAQLLIVVPEAAMQAALMVALIERFPTSLRGTGFRGHLGVVGRLDRGRRR